MYVAEGFAAHSAKEKRRLTSFLSSTRSSGFTLKAYSLSKFSQCCCAFFMGQRVYTMKESYIFMYRIEC